MRYNIQVTEAPQEALFGSYRLYLKKYGKQQKKADCKSVKRFILTLKDILPVKVTSFDSSQM